MTCMCFLLLFFAAFAFVVFGFAFAFAAFASAFASAFVAFVFAFAFVVSAAFWSFRVFLVLCCIYVAFFCSYGPISQWWMLSFLLESLLVKGGPCAFKRKVDFQVFISLYLFLRRWEEMRWDEVRWAERWWDELRGDEMSWGEMRWAERIVARIFDFLFNQAGSKDGRSIALPTYLPSEFLHPKRCTLKEQS